MRRERGRREVFDYFQWQNNVRVPGGNGCPGIQCMFTTVGVMAGEHGVVSRESVSHCPRVSETERMIE